MMARSSSAVLYVINLYRGVIKETGWAVEFCFLEITCASMIGKCEQYKQHFMIY